MLLKVIYIAMGGALGATLRYGTSELVQRWSGGTFPWGTLVVNLLGCFVAGLLFEFFELARPAPSLRLFVFIGVLGGFTTFSSFALECRNLLRDGEFLHAGINILASTAGCLTMVLLGVAAARALTGVFR